jgi:hypothetical protein
LICSFSIPNKADRSDAEITPIIPGGCCKEITGLASAKKERSEIAICWMPESVGEEMKFFKD